MIRREAIATYAAGLLQGVCLVAYPAASTILTSPEEFQLSSAQYGSLFIPQTILSIAASAFNQRLAKTFGSKRIFQTGLIANFFAMSLLALSALFVHEKVLAFILLFIGAASLGLGFGLAVPTLNEVISLLYPTRVDKKVLVLNALLGIGTALAPVFTLLFKVLGFWWGLPLLLVILLFVLILFSLPLTFPKEKEIATSRQIEKPVRLWLFLSFALLYGIMETLNGNWATIYMRELHAPFFGQSLALTAFWTMVTCGRIFYAEIEKIFPEKYAYQLSPLISVIAFIILATLLPGANLMAIFAFGLVGFGCSSLLPLTISFGTRELQSISGNIPGLVISVYLLGYGIAAFGVGALESAFQISLKHVYAIGAFIALILLGLACLVTKSKED